MSSLREPSIRDFRKRLLKRFRPGTEEFAGRGDHHATQMQSGSACRVAWEACSVSFVCDVRQASALSCEHCGRESWTYTRDYNEQACDREDDEKDEKTPAESRTLQMLARVSVQQGRRRKSKIHSDQKATGSPQIMGQDSSYSKTCKSANHETLSQRKL